MRVPLHAVKGQQVGSDNNDNGGLPDNTVVRLTPFVGDQSFQRWLIEKIHQRHEFEFERGALPAIIGFLTNLDDVYYTVSTTSEFPPRSRVLPVHSVTMISETHRSLHDLEDRFEPLIKRYTARIHRAAAEQLMPSLRMARPTSERPRQNSV